MIRLPVSAVAARLGAALHHGEALDDTALIRGVDIDSRRLERGMLFAALPGAHTDGHAYLEDARRRGAAAALVSELQDAALPQLLVDDVTGALQRLALAWRRELDCCVIGITGSNGKTTVKEMLAAILTAALPRDRWLATAGNYNNELGVPLTLLRLHAGHRFAVVEMGCGQPGDIRELAHMARPRIGIVTSIGPAHLERLGSIEGVAVAKSELFEALPPGGLAILPEAAAYAGILRRAANCETLTVGPEAKVRWRRQGDALHIRWSGRSVATRLHLSGDHHADNAALAAAAALALGLPADVIGAGLGGYRPLAGRGQSLAGPNGSVIVDDSYNANPASLLAAVDSLVADYPRHEHWLALGDMAELGGEALHWHRSIGATVRERGIGALFACGPLAAEAARAFGAPEAAYDDVGALANALRERLHAGVAVLIKGSRSAAMERVVAALQQASARDDNGAALRECC